MPEHNDDAIETLVLDLTDWWHIYGTREPWSVTEQPLPHALDEAAREFVKHAAGLVDERLGRSTHPETPPQPSQPPTNRR